MRVSLNWLAELVELPPEAELAERLTFAGLEVEGIERLGAGLEQVVVAQILSSEPHPKADRLSVTTVDAGTEKLQIVCGAKNYKVGDKVPLARVGTVLPDGHKIEAAKLRGVRLLRHALQPEGAGPLRRPRGALDSTGRARSPARRWPRRSV